MLQVNEVKDNKWVMTKIEIEKDITQKMKCKIKIKSAERDFKNAEIEWQKKVRQKLTSCTAASEEGGLKINQRKWLTTWNMCTKRKITFMYNKNRGKYWNENERNLWDETTGCEKKHGSRNASNKGHQEYINENMSEFLKQNDKKKRRTRLCPLFECSNAFGFTKLVVNERDFFELEFPVKVRTQQTGRSKQWRAALVFLRKRLQADVRSRRGVHGVPCSIVFQSVG